MATLPYTFKDLSELPEPSQVSRHCPHGLGASQRGVVRAIDSSCGAKGITPYSLILVVKSSSLYGYKLTAKEP
jgi:hypothetical protein